jgi:hypothetical protein
MVTFSELSRRQEKILEQLSELDTMRKGTITPYEKKKTVKGGSDITYGPYYVLTSKDENQRTQSEQIRKTQLEFFQGQLENHRRYMELVKEYERLSEDKSRLVAAGVTDTADRAKKNEKSK